MTPYVDSGVMVKLYVRESNSPAAARAVIRYRSLELNPVQELEIRNTLRALEGRGTITPAQRAASEHVFDADIAAGRLRCLVPDWPEVFRKAIRLSQDFTAKTHARSLDVLHVAIAVVQGAGLFVTADMRQAAVAKKSGLPIRLLR